MDGPTTALYFLRDRARLSAGERVAIIGASGSIGIAVQLARHFGAEVTAVCSGRNAELVRALGAHEVVDYTREDYAAQRYRYDVVFDTVGASSFAYARRCLRRQDRTVTGRVAPEGQRQAVPQDAGLKPRDAAEREDSERDQVAADDPKTRDGSAGHGAPPWSSMRELRRSSADRITFFCAVPQFRACRQPRLPVAWGEIAARAPGNAVFGFELGVFRPSMDTRGSDAELLQRWGEGSTQAGNELVERHFATLHRFFRNKAGSEVEDLVQQTFLACVEARARFRGDASFKTVLLSIARNQLFKHYSRAERRVVDGSLSSVRDLRTSPTGAIAKRQDQELLLEALRQLPLDAQVILELGFWEGLDAVEIAAVLDLPLNTTYSRLRRAKLALREKLDALAPAGMIIDPDQTASATRSGVLS